jgi:hypothetical protein
VLVGMLLEADGCPEQGLRRRDTMRFSRLILVVGYDSTRLLNPWIPQAPSRIVNTISPP